MNIKIFFWYVASIYQYVFDILSPKYLIKQVIINTRYTSEISGFHGGEYEGDSLLGFCAV
jgi:hypothetical protein